MPIHRVHQIREAWAFRDGRKLFRYECSCGKKGKYQKWSADCLRGANAHLRAVGVTGHFLTGMP